MTLALICIGKVDHLARAALIPACGSLAWNQKNPTLKVKQGDKVVVNFSSTSGFHDFVIDEFNVASKQIPANEISTVEFIADKTGTFSYYCSVGEHRANGMEGEIIVE